MELLKSLSAQGYAQAIAARAVAGVLVDVLIPEGQRADFFQKVNTRIAELIDRQPEQFKSEILPTPEEFLSR